MPYGAPLCARVGWGLHSEEAAMTKSTADAREKLQREAQHAQQEAAMHQQKAEPQEVTGRHQQDGQKDHKGADKGPRGQ